MTPKVELRFVKPLATLLLLFFVLCGLIAWVGPGELHRVDEDGMPTVQDYAYHMLAFQEWGESGGAPYEEETRQRAARRIDLPESASAMPIGISPVGMVLSTPLHWLGGLDLRLSYIVWMAFSVTLLGAAMRMFLAPGDLKSAPLLVGLPLVVVASGAFLRAVVLGQTSPLALALLLFIAALSLRRSPAVEGALGLALLLLLLKPTYGVMGVFWLLGTRHYRAIGGAAVGALVLCGLAEVLTQGGLISSYVATLRLYSDPNSGVYSSWWTAESSMNSLTNTAAWFLGRSRAFWWSNTLYTGGILALGGVALWHGLRKGKPTHLLGYSTLALFLLFVPYGGAYEELLLAVPAFLFLDKQTSLWKGVAVLGLVLLLLNTGGAGEWGAVLHWCVKALFVVAVGVNVWLARGET